MQAFIRKPLFYKLKDLFEEGNVYRISYVAVVDNDGMYKPTQHAYKLCYLFKTIVISTESAVIQRYGLSLIPFDQLAMYQKETDCLVDVIGLLTSVLTDKEVTIDGNRVKLLVIELTSDMGKVQCALFGQYAMQMKGFVTECSSELPVIVIQFVRVKNFRGTLKLQNAMYCTRLLCNPDIAEAINFRNGIADHSYGLADSQQSIGVTDLLKVSTDDDFMKQYPKKNLAELADITENGIFVVLATIVKVAEGSTWWYTACQCHKSVVVDSGLYYCKSCDVHVVNVTPRFKVKVVVSDETETANLLLFDRDVFHLINKTCAQLLSEDAKFVSSHEIPDVFSEFIGKQLLFKVEINSNKSIYKDDSYKVKKICDDSHIIAMFQLDGADNTPTKALFAPPFASLDVDSNHSGSPKSVLSKTTFGKEVMADDINESVVDLSEDYLNPTACLEYGAEEFDMKSTCCKRKLDMDFELEGSSNMKKVLKNVKKEPVSPTMI